MADTTSAERAQVVPTPGGAGRSKQFESLLFPLSVVALLTIWEVTVRWLEVPSYILPPPSEAVLALGRIFTGGIFWENFGVTILEAIVGFVFAFLAAMMVAILITESRIAERVIYPYLAALQSMPKIAIAPLIVLWFGFGLQSKIVLAGLLCFFPMVVNFVSGLRAADELRIRLLRVLDARPWQIIWLVRLPSALPFILAGVELGAIYAMLGAIVGEFIGARSGIGYWLMQMNAIMDTAGSFALLTVLAAYGMLIQWSLRLARRKFLFWTGAARNAKPE